tara:strand:+ start:11 stop:247 length:237 start_codon:yes stop_codon:yes gene_type:complete
MSKYYNAYSRQDGDSPKQRKAPDNYNRAVNKGRKKSLEKSPIKQFAQKMLSATGLPMYLKEESYKDNVAKNRKKRKKD